MRILTPAFLSPSWPLSRAANGIVTYVANAVAAQRQLGNRPYVISADSDPAQLTPDVYPLEWQAPSGLARLREAVMHRVNPAKAHRLRYSKSLIAATQRAIRERGIEFLEMEESFGLLPLVKPHLPIPVVMQIHGPHFLNGAAMGRQVDANFNHRVKSEGAALAAAEAILAPSRDVLERTKSYYGLALPEAVVIPYPAPIVPRSERWSLEDCDRSRLLFVGRFDRHKGGDTAIDAFRLVVQRVPQARLWFAGPADGILIDDQGRRWTREEYVSDRAGPAAARIDWLGHQSNAALGELRRRAMITLVCSRYENFGMVVLEAMVYGCPLVTTRAGGIPEKVIDGSNGFLVEPGDAAGLANAILRMMGAPELAARLGAQGAIDAEERYGALTIARQTAAFYESVLDRRSHRAA